MFRDQFWRQRQELFQKLELFNSEHAIEQAADKAAMSRIVGGIHYHFSIANGQGDLKVYAPGTILPLKLVD